MPKPLPIPHHRYEDGCCVLPERNRIHGPAANECSRFAVTVETRPGRRVTAGEVADAIREHFRTPGPISVVTLT